MLRRFQVDVVYSVPLKLKNNMIKLGKDKIEKAKRTHVIYLLECYDCDKVYVGETLRQVGTREYEHKNNYKKPSKEHTVVTKHRLNEGHEFKWGETKILTTESNLRKRKFTELAFIKKYKDLTINKQTDLDKWKDTYNPLVQYF